MEKKCFMSPHVNSSVSRMSWDNLGRGPDQGNKSLRYLCIFFLNQKNFVILKKGTPHRRGAIQICLPKTVRNKGVKIFLFENVTF